MPANLEARPGERLVALAAVAFLQFGIGLALLIGLRGDFERPAENAERLIAVALSRPTPPRPPPPVARARPAAAAATAEAATPGAAPPRKRAPSSQAPPTPVIAIRPLPAPAAGGAGGVGVATGRGPGGGTGGNGSGASGAGDGGGTELVQIAGAITDRDYPRHLRETGLGGRVSVLFTVESNGRVGRCSVTRSSGVVELDRLTCQLIQQRFRYRPSTDRYGRPIADEVDGDQDWDAR
ncbi:MAG: TonB family protein [Sphingomicrobium sp.]